MTLELTDRDALILHEVLQAYRGELRREVARTDVRDLRHALVERQDLVERLLDLLAPART